MAKENGKTKPVVAKPFLFGLASELFKCSNWTKAATGLIAIWKYNDQLVATKNRPFYGNLCRVLNQHFSPIIG